MSTRESDWPPRRPWMGREVHVFKFENHQHINESRNNYADRQSTLVNAQSVPSTIPDSATDSLGISQRGRVNSLPSIPLGHAESRTVAYDAKKEAFVQSSPPSPGQFTSIEVFATPAPEFRPQYEAQRRDVGSIVWVSPDVSDDYEELRNRILCVQHVGEEQVMSCFPFCSHLDGRIPKSGGRSKSHMRVFSGRRPSRLDLGPSKMDPLGVSLIPELTLRPEPNIWLDLALIYQLESSTPCVHLGEVKKSSLEHMFKEHREYLRLHCGLLLTDMKNS